MIVHEMEAVYVHIPKTAGVSVCHAMMSEVLGKETIGWISKLPPTVKKRFSLLDDQRHKQARFFVPADIPQETWDKYFKFAIVRNPWDRVVSEFCWRHSLDSRHPSKDFDKFINYCETRLNDPTNTAHDIYWTHAQTQSSYVTEKGKVIVDKMFKFEELPEVIEHLETRFNINIKKHNSSNHNQYREYYNDNTRERIAKLYNEDIERFDYEF